MPRRLLAIAMTFMLVVGPSLCCCTTASALTPRSLTTPSPDSTPPCCCKDQCLAGAGAASSEAQGVGGTQHDPKPGKHQCPCKEKGGKQALGQTAPSSQEAQDLSRLLTTFSQDVVVAFDAETAVESGHDAGGCSSPPGYRLSSWRLLQAQHVLRC